MARSRFSLVQCALLATACLGCGTERKVQEFANQYRQAIEDRLVAWPTIAEQLRNLPPLPTIGVDGKHVLIVDTLAEAGKRPTASLCYAEDLENPDELGYVWGRMENTGGLNHCASLLHRGHLAYDPAKPEATLPAISMAETLRRFPHCGAYRYLLVLRTLEFVPPSSATQATQPFAPITELLSLDAIPDQPPPPSPARRRPRSGAKVAKSEVARSDESASPDPLATPTRELLSPEQNTDRQRLTRHGFEGGMLRAEALLFELPSGKLLGGTRFAAQNSVQVGGVDDAIELDLRYKIKAAMLDAVKNVIAGADFQGATF
jgi:hypothetical protein